MRVDDQKKMWEAAKLHVETERMANRAAEYTLKKAKYVWFTLDMQYSLNIFNNCPKLIKTKFWFKIKKWLYTCRLEWEEADKRKEKQEKMEQEIEEIKANQAKILENQEKIMEGKYKHTIYLITAIALTTHPYLFLLSNISR